MESGRVCGLLRSAPEKSMYVRPYSPSPIHPDGVNMFWMSTRGLLADWFCVLAQVTLKTANSAAAPSQKKHLFFVSIIVLCPFSYGLNDSRDRPLSLSSFKAPSQHCSITTVAKSSRLSAFV